MTARLFLDGVVKPNVAEFHREYGSVRLAWNAIASIDALAAHMFLWCQAHAPGEVAGLSDDTERS